MSDASTASAIESGSSLAGLEIQWVGWREGSHTRGWIMGYFGVARESARRSLKIE